MSVLQRQYRGRDDLEHHELRQVRCSSCDDREPARRDGDTDPGRGTGRGRYDPVWGRVLPFAVHDPVHGRHDRSLRPRIPGTRPNTLAYTGAITLGSTQTIVKTIVCGVGGPGAWAAESPAAGESMLANGGANGNFDLQTICATASQSFLAGIDFNEGLY